MWHLQREEPVVYINGRPYVLREAARPFKNLLEYHGIVPERLERMEARLRVREGGCLPLFQFFTFGGVGGRPAGAGCCQLLLLQLRLLGGNLTSTCRPPAAAVCVLCGPALPTAPPTAAT